MQAVMNLSGEGTLLRPLSCQKCGGMLDLCGKTIAERNIEFLKRHNIDDIVIITGYMGEGVKSFFEDGEKWGVNIKYAHSMSSDIDLKCHGDILEESFLYISKLVYMDFDLETALKFHYNSNAYATILTRRGGGEVVTGKGGRVTRIEERRLWQNLFGAGGMGIYFLNRDVIRFMPAEGSVSLWENVLPALIRAGKGIYAKAVNGYVDVIGDFASYMRAVFYYLDTLKAKDNKGIEIENGAVIEQGAVLESPCYVGRGAHICKGAKIGSYSTVGEGSVVKGGATLKRSLVGKGCRVGKNVNMRGSISDDATVWDEGSAAYEQAIVGKGCRIGAFSTVKSFVKIWPEKTIEKGKNISENVMWGQRKKTRLFEEGRIRGIINSDITPIFCTRLGESIGMMNALGEVGISHDGSPAGVMLRDALAAGLLGSGCRVKDFGEQPLPITRRGTGFYMLSGAVCINVTEEEGEDAAEITILGKMGMDIDEKEKARLEELFEKGDFVYPEPKRIRECEYVFEYKIYYLKSIVGEAAERKSSLKLLLSCGAVWGRRLIASAIADFFSNVSMYHPSVGEGANENAFCQAVKMGGFDMGFVLDAKCERLKIVLDDTVIDDDIYDALTNLIIMKKYPGADIFVPAKCTSRVDMLAEKYNCSVKRTSSVPIEIMRHLSGEEKYLSEEFIFRFDAVAAVILLVDYMTREGVGIRELLEEIPNVATAKAMVEMPREEMGRVISKIYEYPNASRVADGVKISFDKGWVVIVPDAQKEIFEVVSEGAKSETARELCDICINDILLN